MMRYVEAGFVLLGQLGLVLFRQVRARLLRLVAVGSVLES